MHYYFFTTLFCLFFGSLLGQQQEPINSDLSPYIEDSRAIKLIGQTISDTSQQTITQNGKTYYWFASRDQALDFFQNLDRQLDYMEVFINEPSFGTEMYEIRRKILRKSYYDTNLDREISSIVQLN